MFLNKDFIALYEELSELNEAKADTQRLIDFAGEELANRFLVIKNRLKAPENDIYYWIKNKTPEELEQAVSSLENNKSNNRIRKDAIKGGTLVCETEHWKVYHITTFEASQYYGRDTKWCITGINDWEDKYWNRYTGQGIQFYFLITKDKYDPRGSDSKIAIAVYPDNETCEVYNQQDALIPLSSIPYLDEINIPGIAINNITNNIYCFDCEKLLSPEEIWTGLHNEVYCEDCFKETYFKCAKCGRVCYNIAFLEDRYNNRFCLNCSTYSDLQATGSGFYYELDGPSHYIRGETADTEVVIERLSTYIDSMTSAERTKTRLLVISNETGEILYDKNDLASCTMSDLLKEIRVAIENY